MTSKAIVPFGPGSAPGGSGVAQPAKNIAEVTTPTHARILFIKKSHSQIEIFNCGFAMMSPHFPQNDEMPENRSRRRKEADWILNHAIRLLTSAATKIARETPIEIRRKPFLKLRDEFSTRYSFRLLSALFFESQDSFSV